MKRCFVPRVAVVLTSILLWFGCASVKIDSHPTDASVYVVFPGQATEREVGKTPIEIDINEFDEIRNQGAMVFVIKKQGYLSQHFVVPNISHTDLKISTSLLPDLPSNYEEVNKLIALAFKGERLILQKRFSEALKVGEKIRDMNPNIATAYELIGTAQYLQNNLREARYAWIRVLELEPQNVEAHKMLASVETRMGVRQIRSQRAKK